MSLHDADFGIDKSTNQRHSLQGGGCKAEAGIWMERDEETGSNSPLSIRICIAI